MKRLYNFLRESLLDDMDDLINTSDKNVQHTAVNEPDFISIYGSGWKAENDSAILNLSIRNKNKNSPYDYKPIRLGTDQKSIDDWLKTKEVIVKSDSYSKSDANTLRLDCNLLSKNTFSKKIIFDNNTKNSRLVICGRNLLIKDIDIEFNGVDGGLSVVSDWDQIKIENVNISLNNNSIKNLIFRTEWIPSFKNFKSNVKEIQISDTFMFDDEKCIKQLDSILDLPYTCKVYDNNKKTEVDINIKTFKKIHALINNHRRYRLIEPVLRFKQGTKLNDLLDVSGCKDLRRLWLNNNLVQLEFTKGNIFTKSNIFTKDNIGNIRPHMAQLDDDWVASIYKR